jgi:hypothetical protein
MKSLPGLTWQSVCLEKMDARIKSAHDDDRRFRQTENWSIFAFPLIAKMLQVFV